MSLWWYDVVFDDDLREFLLVERYDFGGYCGVAFAGESVEDVIDELERAAQDLRVRVYAELDEDIFTEN